MADEEKKVTENADAEKNKKGFAFNDVEVAVGKMMTPTVKKVLEDKYHVDMAAMLPVIHQNSPAIEGDTIEAYAQRCIEAALASQVQQTAVEKIEEKRGKKEVAKVELDEEAAPKKEETPEPTQEGEDVYKKADEIQRKIVLAMLGLPFKMIKAIVEAQNVAAVFNKNNTASVVQLSKDETEFVCNSMQKAKDMLSKAYEIDGLEVQSEQEQEEAVKKADTKSEEVIEPTQEGEKDVPADDGTMKLKNGKEVSYKEYKEILDKIAATPEMKSRLESLGLTVDDIASQVFGKINVLENESLEAYVLRTFDKVTTETLMKNAVQEQSKVTIKENLFSRPVENKSTSNPKEGIKADEEEKSALDIFKSIASLVGFPFKFFKAVLTGKTDEETKLEMEKTNVKEVVAVLSPEIRKNLLNKINGYEMDSFRVAEKLGIVMVQDGGVYNPVDKNEQPQPSPIDADKALEDADKALSGETFKEPKGRRKIVPAHITGNVEDNKKILSELVAEVDKLDFSDPVATMVWVSDLARVSEGSNGPTMSDEDRSKVVEVLEKNHYYSKGDIKLPSYDTLTQKAKQAYILTAVSRMLGNDGKGKVSMEVAKMAEAIVAKESPEQAIEALVVGKEAYDRSEPKVDRSKMSQADSAYQQKIDKLMKDFEVLDFTDRSAVMAWMKEYGKTAEAMESIPDIDKAAIEKRFKENGIDTRVGAAKKFSSNEKDKANATEWCVTSGALDILSTGRINDKILDKMGRVMETPTSIQEQDSTRTPESVQVKDEVLPLTEIGTNATRKITEEALEHNKGNIEGADLVDSMKMDMHPELLAALEDKTQEQDVEDDHYPRRPETR